MEMENLNGYNKSTNIDQHNTTIALIGKWIKEIIDAAMIDFQMLSSLLKDYDKLFDARTAPEAAERISQSVQELQCMDIFIQKLEHLSRLNGILCREEFPVPKTVNDNNWDLYSSVVIRLNYFQSIAATYDFTSLVSNLKKHLNEFHCHIMKVPSISFSDADYFRHNDFIVTKLSLLTSILSELSKKCLHAGVEVDAAMRERISKIETIYSIESERYVLLWFIGNNQGTEAELLAQYSNRFYDDTNQPVDNNNIELF